MALKIATIRSSYKITKKEAIEDAKKDMKYEIKRDYIFYKTTRISPYIIKVYFKKR